MGEDGRSRRTRERRPLARTQCKAHAHSHIINCNMPQMSTPTSIIICPSLSPCLCTLAVLHVCTNSQSYASARTQHSYASARTQHSYASARTQHSYASARTTQQSYASARTTQQSYASARTTQQSYASARTTQQSYASARTQQSYASARTTHAHVHVSINKLTRVHLQWSLLSVGVHPCLLFAH